MKQQYSKFMNKILRKEGRHPASIIFKILILLSTAFYVFNLENILEEKYSDGVSYFLVYYAFFLVFALICMIIISIRNIVINIKISKTLKTYSNDYLHKVDKDFDNSIIFTDKTFKVYISNNYLIGRLNGLHVIPITNIKEIYFKKVWIPLTLKSMISMTITTKDNDSFPLMMHNYMSHFKEPANVVLKELKMRNNNIVVNGDKHFTIEKK